MAVSEASGVSVELSPPPDLTGSYTVDMMLICECEKTSERVSDTEIE